MEGLWGDNGIKNFGMRRVEPLEEEYTKVIQRAWDENNARGGQWVKLDAKLKGCRKKLT